MADVLSRILAEALGGPPPPAEEAGRRGGGPPPMQQQARRRAADQAAQQAGGGLDGLLHGLLGAAPGAGQGATIAGARQVAVLGLLGWLMGGHGGTRGLGALTGQLRSAGLGAELDSWIGTGPNRALRPAALARAVPPETLDAIEARTGLGREAVLEAVARGLPGMVDALTPAGRLPERDAELEGLEEAAVLAPFGLGAG